MRSTFLPTILLVVLILFTSRVDAQSVNTFAKNFNNPGIGNMVRETADKGFIIVGGEDIYDFNGYSVWDASAGAILRNGDIILTKTDIDGELEWQKTYGTDDRRDVGQWMEITTDGGFIIVGASTTELNADVDLIDSTDILLLKTDSEGNLEWSKIYDTGGDDMPWSVQQTSDGGFMISAFCEEDVNAPDARAMMIKTDMNGNLEWEKKFQGGFRDPMDDSPFTYVTKQTADNGYVLVGTTQASQPSDVYVIRTDTDGNMLWSNAYSAEGGILASGGYDIHEMSDGSFAIAGFRDSIFMNLWWSNLPYTLKIGSDGSLITNKLWNYTAFNFKDGFSCVKEDFDGNLLFCGTGGYWTGGGWEFSVLKTDPAIEEIWGRVYMLGGAVSVIPSVDGGYAVTGQYFEQDMGLFKMDAVGLINCWSPDGFEVFDKPTTTIPQFPANTSALTVDDWPLVPVDVTEVPNVLCTVDCIDSAYATIDPAGPYCVDDPAIVLVSEEAGGTWSGTGITDVDNGDFDPSVATAGAHLITYDHNSGECGQTDTETIIVNPLDDASFDYPALSFCQSDDDPIANITGTAGGTFSIDGGGSIDPVDGTIDLSATGIGDFTVTYLTAGPCPASATFDITITAGSDATITAAGPFCETDAAVNLAAIDPGGTWSGTGITDAVAGTFDPSVAGAGTFDITYEILGACTDSDVETIIVNGTDDASFNYPSVELCLNEANPTPIITGLPGGVFSIDGVGVIDPVSGEIDLLESGVGVFVITYSTTGPCPNSATASITITDSVEPLITEAGPFCLNDPEITLEVDVSGGIWEGAGLVDPENGIFSPSVAGEGFHEIIYSVGGACSGTSSITIEVNGLPTATVSPDQTIGPGEIVQIEAGGGVIFSWDPTTDLSCGDCPNPVASPMETTTYCVTVTDLNGCQDEECLTITIVHDTVDTLCGTVYVPNAFTPGADERNNHALVYGTCLEQLTFRIFNRWGELLFESNDQSQGWDGTYKGEEMMVGVYVWTVTAMLQSGEWIEKTGHISIIR